MYSKLVIEEIIRLQALGFSGEETRETLQNKFGIRPCLDTVYRHRRSPIGAEMLHELIRHQERDILKADSEGQRQIAMRYRDKLIEKLMDKLMPDLAQIESTHTERIEEIKVLWLKNESNTDNKLRTTQRATTVP